MRQQLRLIVSLAVLALLGACATTANLKELRQLTPQGTPYAMALTREYLRISEEEARAYDWSDSSYFAEKGLMAGYGQVVLPEQVDDWDVPQEMKPELQAAREKLLSLTNEANRNHRPEASAQATAAFDRWLEELEEGWNQTAISQKQEALYRALEELEFIVLEAEEQADATALKGGKTSSTAYLVYFGLDKYTLDEAARQVLQQVADDIAAAPPAEIVINGHTDSSGEESFNLKLSEKRAMSVLQTLIELGVPEKLLRYFGFGESDPAVDKGDNVTEPRNRRAEIFLG